MAAKKKKVARDQKVTVVFNEDARREYLLGFRKRKNERRKKAQEQLQKQEHEKKKQLRVEKRKMFLDQVEKQKKELEALESDDSTGEDVVIPSVNATFEHPEHIVTVTTVDDIDLTSDSFTCIGPNKGLPESKKVLLAAPTDKENIKAKGKKLEKNFTKKRNNFKKTNKKKTHGLKGFPRESKTGKSKTSKKRKGHHPPEKSKRAKKS